MSQKRAKIRYNVEEAIQKIFEPSLDSDIGDLSDSESEKDVSMNDKDDVLLDEQSNSEQSENESERGCELNPALHIRRPIQKMSARVLEILITQFDVLRVHIQNVEPVETRTQHEEEP